MPVNSSAEQTSKYRALFRMFQLQQQAQRCTLWGNRESGDLHIPLRQPGKKRRESLPLHLQHQFPSVLQRLPVNQRRVITLKIERGKWRQLAYFRCFRKKRHLSDDRP